MSAQRTIGIGLGPSNLALAIALEEQSASRECGEWIFLERNEKVKWHTDMLLKGSRLQISFLKDLVTLRNPTSYFTFVNYLKCRGRLDYFINRSTFNASREEFTDYLNWVHEHLPETLTQMSRTVRQVIPIVGIDGEVDKLEVIHEDKAGQEYRLLADNLVVAVGGVPYIPDVFQRHVGDHLFHSAQFLSHVDQYVNRQERLRFGVIGSGQSAVEIIHYLCEHFPNSEVHVIIRKAAFKPADNSPFVNEGFFPSMTNFMYDLSNDRKREDVLKEYWQTNYAAVDLNLLESLYEKIYSDKVSGKQQIYIKNYSTVEKLEPLDNGYVATCSNAMTGNVDKVVLDAIVLATGYERSNLPAFMDLITPYIQMTNGRYEIGRNYELQMKPSFKPRIYLQGMSQLTHGISDSLLSVLAIRSNEILQSILDGQEQSDNTVMSKGVLI